MNLSFFLGECKNRILRYKFLILALVLAFLTSTMCGIIIVKPTLIIQFCHGYCENYMYKVFSLESGIFSVLISRCIGNTLFLVVVCLSSTVIFVFPLQIFAIFYRGFIFGVEIFILFAYYTVGGFFVVILLLLPQAILCGGILIFSTPFSLECGLTAFQARSLEHMRGFLPWLVFFGAICLFSALLEFFTVLIFFKPFALIL